MTLSSSLPSINNVRRAPVCLTSESITTTSSWLTAALHPKVRPGKITGPLKRRNVSCLCSRRLAVSEDQDRGEVLERPHSTPPCCAVETPDHDDLPLTPARPGKGPYWAFASPITKAHMCNHFQDGWSTPVTPSSHQSPRSGLSQTLRAGSAPPELALRNWTFSVFQVSFLVINKPRTQMSTHSWDT